MTVPLIFDESRPGRTGASFPKPEVPVRPIDELIPPKFLRSTPLRLPEVSEGTAVRHFTRLSVMNHHIDKDIYPLGSCTMKYNPKINERIARLPTIASAHPLSPPEFAQGPLRLIYELGELLKSITGFDAITLQPAAGAQSELTGLLVIRAYHHSRNNTKTHMLQPDSAHGTNPASATLAGYDSVSIPTNSEGLVDLDALKKAVNDETAGLMITNPNTLGLFEKDIEEIAEVIHSVDGLIYMDGANLNAILSIAIPALTGVDMVHVNLHKTFSTPHGGGGPGGGCLAVTGSLGKFLPTPRVVESDGRYDLSWDAPQSVGKIHGFWGNVGVMTRAYAYIRMMGAEGLARISKTAIINANYLRCKLKHVMALPYDRPCMHEVVFSGSRQKAKSVGMLDIAKRVLDFGVYAPTVYFPLVVPEAMMIEPTESETRETLDRFAEIIEQIAAEVDSDSEVVLTAPHNTPVGRLDEVRAARSPDLRHDFG